MKKSGQFLFESRLVWQAGTMGVLSSGAVDEPIKVESPKTRNAEDSGKWSGEHLLTGAVSSGFMTTFLFFAKQKGLNIASFECEVIGQVTLMNNKLKFTELNVYPTIGIDDEEMTSLAYELIDAAKEKCLVARALKINIFYHPVVETRKETVQQKTKKTKPKREYIF